MNNKETTNKLIENEPSYKLGGYMSELAKLSRTQQQQQQQIETLTKALKQIKEKCAYKSFVHDTAQQALKDIQQ